MWVLSLEFDRQTVTFGSVFGLFGVTTIVGVTLFPCGSNEPGVESKKSENELKKQIDLLVKTGTIRLPVSMSPSVLEFEFLWRHKNGEDNGDGC